MAHRRQQLRGAAEQGLGTAAAGQFLAQPGQLALARRLHLQQAVDEHPVAMRGRDAAGRGMWRGQQAQILQVAQDVADGGRADLQAGHARQRLRADRLAVLMYRAISVRSRWRARGASWSGEPCMESTCETRTLDNGGASPWQVIGPPAPACCVRGC